MILIKDAAESNSGWKGSSCFKGKWSLRLNTLNIKENWYKSLTKLAFWKLYTRLEPLLQHVVNIWITKQSFADKVSILLCWRRPKKNRYPHYKLQLQINQYKVLLNWTRPIYKPKNKEVRSWLRFAIEILRWQIQRLRCSDTSKIRFLWLSPGKLTQTG